MIQKLVSHLFSIFAIIAIIASIVGTSNPVPTASASVSSVETPIDHSVMFIENAGQFDEGARFQVQGGNSIMWLAVDGIWITLLEKPESNASKDFLTRNDPLFIDNEMENTPVKGVNIKLSFDGANTHPTLEPINLLDTSVNYFIGNDPGQWHQNVPVWGGVRYKDLYPGIDLEIKGQNGQVRQQLVVREEADLSAVKLNVDGADVLLLEGEHLLMKTVLGDYLLPLVQVSGNGTTSLPNVRIADYKVITPFSISRDMIEKTSSESESSDLLYSSFVGGSDSEYTNNNSIAIDSHSSAYIIGETRSMDFPTTPGAFDTTNNKFDAYVIKMNETGADLSYATFIGGTENDYGNDIVVNETGEAFITGDTNSNDFPITPDAYDDNPSGFDGFVLKLNSNGTGLVFSTFTGIGSGHNTWGIAIDGDDNAYVTGEYIIQTLTAAYILKFNYSGTTQIYKNYVYKIYYVPNSILRVNDIVVNSNGEAFITGYTNVEDLPVTSNAYDSTFNGYYDAFISKIDPSGSMLEYSSYLGGTAYDFAKSLATDESGAIYIRGYTGSIDFPLTPLAFDKTNENYNESFVTKLSPSGSDLLYSTLIGPELGQTRYTNSTIVVDDKGIAYISGETNSSNFPVTPGAFDTSYNGGADAYVVKLNQMGSNLLYSSFIGGSSDDYDEGIALNTDGVVYMTGQTNSTDFPTIPGSFDTSYNGGFSDAFVLKFSMGATNIKISHIEITQAIQDELNNVTLIANKPTFARVYVDCGEGCNSLQNITGTLRCEKNGEQIGLPIHPVNISITANHQEWTEQRGDLRKSLNFTLPQSWLSAGEITLIADIQGIRFHETTTFYESKPLKIAYIKIRENRGPSEIYTPNDIDIQNSENLFTKIIPAAEFDYYGLQNTIEWTPPEIFYDCWYCLYLNLSNLLSRSYQDEFGDFLIGWLPTESIFSRGGFASIYSPIKLGRYAVVKSNSDSMIRNQRITHELGHLLGAHHTWNVECDEQAWSLPWPKWPYDTSVIQEWGVDGYGFSWLGSTPNALFDPMKTYDFMSYCRNESGKWISPYTSNRMYEFRLQPEAANYTNNIPSEDQLYFDISSLVFSNNTAYLDPIWIVATDNPDILPQGNDYCLETQDNEGNLINQSCFDLDFINSETGEESTVDGFRTMIIYNAVVKRLALKKGNVEIAFQLISTNAPSLVITYPNGEETWDQASSQTITWNAADVDGDDLLFDLEYSSDGINWKPIGSNLSENQFVINSAELPGSTSAMIRVTATDGFNTVSDISDAPFTVAEKGPAASIHSPEESGVTIGSGFVMLQGSGYDIEDGSLADASLSWSSSVDGLLGTGSIIQTNLSPGQHTITLTATDSDGTTGTATTVINVATCYYLTVTHSGQGSDPVANPGYSAICPTGYYLEGESIGLSGASPDTNWLILGWTGTSNDGSTASTNSLTMPGNDYWVAVNYVPDTFPPAVPTLKYPAAGATVRGTPAYSWNAAADAAAFYFQYDDNSDFSSPVFTSAELSSTNYKPPLQSPGIYYWHVKARDAAGNWSNWSAYRTITIKPLKPVAPVLVSPVSGKFTNDNTPTLSWNSVPYGIKYQVQVSKTNTFNTIEQNKVLDLGITKLTTNKLPDGKHFWRVRAINSLNEQGAWSLVRYFTVDTVKPAAPLLSSPANGASVTYIPTYKWQAVTGAKYYQFSYASNSTLTTGVFKSAKLTVLTFKPATQAKKTWYWRVRCQDAAGNWSNWSLVRKIVLR